jgi:hypothetical protein
MPPVNIRFGNGRAFIWLPLPMWLYRLASRRTAAEKHKHLPTRNPPGEALSTANRERQDRGLAKNVSLQRNLFACPMVNTLHGYVRVSFKEG